MDRRAVLAGLFGLPLFAKAAAAAAGATTLEPLDLATGWLGTRPSIASLHGRVTIVDVFTFECINCRNGGGSPIAARPKSSGELPVASR